MIRIDADTDRCEGHGLCQDFAPEVFDVDDDGVVHVLLDPVPDELAGQAESGARSCPVAALSVTADG